MKVSHPLVTKQERISLILQEVDHHVLEGASVSISTGNWEDLLPMEMSQEDLMQLKRVVAETSAWLVRLVLIAIAQDLAAFNGVQTPHLTYLVQAIEEVEEEIGFEAWAMSPDS